MYHGGKVDALDKIYPRIGKVDVLAECFGGRMDFTLNYPHKETCKHIIVGDINAGLQNFHRACKYAPEQLAELCSIEMKSELDVIARNNILVRERLNLEKLLKSDDHAFHLEHALRYWYCQCLFVDTAGRGSNRNKCSLSWSHDSMDIKDKHAYFKLLSKELAPVSVLYRDYRETINTIPEVGTVGMLIDAPYSHDVRQIGQYEHDDPDIAEEAAEYAVVLGKQKNWRICFCGIEGEHDLQREGWTCVTWPSAKGRNGSIEALWFSPHCLKVDQ
jgi:site-specific DNA-adenine methylase